MRFGAAWIKDLELKHFIKWIQQGLRWQRESLFGLKLSRDVQKGIIRDICGQVKLLKNSLTVVDMMMQAGEWVVNERTWHRGDVALERVVNSTNRPSIMLPP